MTYFKAKIDGTTIFFGILFSSIIWFWDSPEHTRFFYFRDYVLFISTGLSVYFLVKSLQENSAIKISVLDIVILLTGVYFIFRSNNFSFQNEFLIKFILVFCFYFSIKTYKNNLQLIQPITVSLVSILFILSVIAFIVYFRNLVKWVYPNIPAYNFNYASAFTDYMILGAVITASYYYVQKQSNSPKFLKSSSILRNQFGFIALIASMSNFSLLFVSVLTINMVRALYEKLNYKRSLIVLFIGLIALTVSITLLKQQQIISKSLRYFPISLKVAKENLVFGTGLGTYNKVYNTAQSHYFNDKFNNVSNIWATLMSGHQVTTDDWTSYSTGKIPFTEFLVADKMKTPENEYIKILLETGVIGLALILSAIGIFVYAFYKLEDKKNNPITGFALGIMAILIAAFFSFPFHEIPLILIIALMLGIVVDNSGFKNYFIVEKANNLIYASIILLTVVASIGLWNIMSVKQSWRTAALEAQKGNFIEEKYKNLYTDLKNNPEFLENYGTELAISQKYNESIKLLDEAMHYTLDGKILCAQAENYFQTNQLEKAKNVYQVATNILPTEIYPKYREMNFYFKIGDKETGIQKARIISDIDVGYKDKGSRAMKKAAIHLLDSLKNK